MLFSTAGCKFFIGGAMQMQDADLTESDFDSQNWTEVMQHENLGSLGDEPAQLDVKPIRGDRVKRLKGLHTAADLELVCNLDSEDTGQVAMVAAGQSRENFAFRLQFPPMPDGGTPPERLFIAVVGGISEQFDDADTAMKLNINLWRNSNVVRVDAVEAV